MIKKPLERINYFVERITNLLADLFPVNTVDDLLDFLHAPLNRRSKCRSDLILDRFHFFVEPVEGVLDLAKCFQRLIIQDVSHLMRFICERFHRIRTGFDQRVQIRCALSEELHRKGITFGFVLNFSECIDCLVEDFLVVPEIAICIRYGNTQLRKCLCRCSCPAFGRSH